MAATKTSVTLQASGAELLPSNWLSVSGNQVVDAGGHPVRIAGVNYSGLEAFAKLPTSSWNRPYTYPKGRH